MGGGIKGGRIAGRAGQGRSQANLIQNRDYPVLTDYRAAARRPVRPDLRPAPARLQAVFPQAQPTDLALV